MTLFALALVLAAAFCHATWNLMVKRNAGGPELVWLFSIISPALYLPVAVAILLGEGDLRRRMGRGGLVMAGMVLLALA